MCTYYAKHNTLQIEFLEEKMREISEWSNVTSVWIDADANIMGMRGGYDPGPYVLVRPSDLYMEMKMMGLDVSNLAENWNGIDYKYAEFMESMRRFENEGVDEYYKITAEEYALNKAHIKSMKDKGALFLQRNKQLFTHDEN